VRAHADLRAHDREIALSPWLYRIVHNCAVDAVRRPLPLPVGDRYSHPAGDDPAATVVGRLELRALLAAIADLPDRHRTVVLRHAVHGESHADVAHDLGVSEGACKVLLVRARKRLVAAAA
jgi:RNA polymerase sigma-70 factor (ECF subfamily)